MSDIQGLWRAKQTCLKTVLGLYKTANAGHIGSSLSCLDLMVYLFFQQMAKDDEFVLSKGHAAAGLYTVLAESGRIEKSMLDTYYTDGTYLAAHPPCGKGKIPGIPFGTGSLGHGLSIATGLALACQYTKKERKIYCIVSDGDCNEGSTWEAILFAAQHKLSNLIMIIDFNGLQGFGFGKDVVGLEPLEDKLRAFNFETFSIKNGNDLEEINSVFQQVGESKSAQPKCLIAHTTKGSGVSYMEDKMEWHYLPMNDEQYQTALEEIK